MRCRPFQQIAQHRACQTLSARRGVHRHLPDEQSVRPIRDAIAGYAADQIAVSDGGYGSILEMTALQQVAVCGIGIEWGTVMHQPVQRHTIGRRKGTKFKWDGFVNR
ncbi:hypothetical protein NTGBS_410010 [Candidatus Nitrotoga sp. BS]|nr:hypothetical protein NTGBS_410010 [Candidatus Nitrotoga sp. BS]